MRKKYLLKIVKWFFGVISGLFLLISLLLYIFEDDICNMVVTEMNKHLKSKVKVSEVDLVFWGSFPNLSVDFNHVFIQDSYKSSEPTDTLFYSDRVRLKFNPLDMIRDDYTLKSIEVSKGTMQLRVDSMGVNNFDILKESKDKNNSEFEVNLEDVQFNDFHVMYENEATKQTYSASLKNLALSGSLSSKKFTAKATSQMKINKAQSGEVNFVTNQPAKLDIEIATNLETSEFNIPKSTIYISNLPFTFSGKVDTAGYKFDLHAKNIQITDVAKNLALDETKKVKKFSGSGKLKFDLNIDGKNEATSPAKILCEFGVTNGRLKDPTSGVTLNALNVDGKYSNSDEKEGESLALKNLSFKTKGGPFKGDLKITDFDQPYVVGSAFGLLNLGVIHSLFSIPTIQKMSGQADVGTKFKIRFIPDDIGELDFVIERCRGDVKLKDAQFQMKNDKRVFRSIQGALFLNDNEAGLKDLSVLLGKSDFKASGTFKNIIRFFYGKGELESDIEITSSFINVSDLGSTNDPFQDDMVVKHYMLPENIKGELYLNVKKLIYDGHSFTNLKGNMNIQKRVLNFPSITVNNSGARIEGQMTISERLPELFDLNLKVGSRNIELSEAFKEWNNFMQDVITDKNISGKAKVNMTLEAPFSLNKGVLSSGIIAKINLKVIDGRLKNVSSFKEIIASMRNSYLRPIIGKENLNELDRKLMDLRFKTLTNTIVIRNKMITIPQMSIESSAIDMEVSGKHTFDNQIDYRFGFRFRDLKKKETSEFGEIIDDGTGMRVYMRMYGDLDNPSIEWDKQSRKAQLKESIAQEKITAKSILKAEFGMFKKDSTLKEYVPDAKPKPKMEVIFNEEEIDEPIIEKEPKPKKGIFKKIADMQKEAEEKKKSELEFIDD